MPIYLKPNEDISRLSAFQSVLIAPCPICPAISLAVSNKEPYMEIHKRFLKTGTYQRYQDKLRRKLEKKGTRTGVFTSYLPNPLMCLWLENQRNKLAKSAKNYNAVAVMGCDAATFNVVDAVRDLDCKVLQVMKVDGIVTAVPTFRFPFSVYLKTEFRNSVSWPKNTSPREKAAPGPAAF